jgi:hypothetical protein
MRTARGSTVAAGAAVLLFVFAGVASANRLSFSSQTFRTTFTGISWSGGFGSVSCFLTLEGSLHARSFTKTVNALIGYITRASIGLCGSGSATVLTATLPWHLRYESFSGTLPIIDGIFTSIIGEAFQIREPFGITCLYRTSTFAPGRATWEREESGTLTKTLLGGTIETSCGVNTTVTGISSTPTVVGATTRITVVLI